MVMMAPYQPIDYVAAIGGTLFLALMYIELKAIDTLKRDEPIGKTLAWPLILVLSIIPLYMLPVGLATVMVVNGVLICEASRLVRGLKGIW